jgi:hypothetical protein
MQSHTASCHVTLHGRPHRRVFFPPARAAALVTRKAHDIPTNPNALLDWLILWRNAATHREATFATCTPRVKGRYEDDIDAHP